MKRKTVWLLLCALLLLCPAASAEDLQHSVQELIGSLELGALERAAETSGWFEGGAAQALGRLASGQPVLSAQEVVQALLTQAAGVFSKSVWRMSRLLVPALLVASAEWLGSRTGGQAARYAGLIMTMALLISDLREHVGLATETVGRMAEWMQALFPILITLLAALGGTASSAFTSRR